MFADIYLIDIGRTETEKRSKVYSKKGRINLKRKERNITNFFETKINKEETNTTGKRPREEGQAININYIFANLYSFMRPPLSLSFFRCNILYKLFSFSFSFSFLCGGKWKVVKRI